MVKKKLEAVCDLETGSVAVSKQPVVVSIGIAAYDLMDDTRDVCPNNTFYGILKWEDQHKKGADLSDDVLDWWDKQPREALEIWNHKDAEDVIVVLTRLTQFIKDKNITCMYGNGSNFDNPILRGLYDMYGMQFPIHFRKDFCMRTLKKVAKAKGFIKPTWLGRRLIKHNALDDAIYEAWLIKHMWNFVMFS